MRIFPATLACLGLLAGCPAPPAPSARPPRRAVTPRAHRPPPARPPRKRARPAAPRRRAPALSQGTALVVGPGAVRQLRVCRTTLVAWLGQSVRGWSRPALRPAWSVAAPPGLSDVRMSADGRWLLLTLTSGTNLVYDTRARPPQRFRRWKRKRGQGQALSADGSILVRGDIRHSVRGYELQTFKMKWLVKADRFSLSPDGRVVTLHRGARVWHVDAVTGRPATAPAPARSDPVARFRARHGAIPAGAQVVPLGSDRVAVAGLRAGRILVYRLTP